jgi:predicted regulator of Ras-like GTPase activity (Roadblock/LC7/MglB family)
MTTTQRESRAASQYVEAGNGQDPRGATTRQERILAILDQLSVSVAGDVTGALAVSMDGIVLAARLSNDVNADRVGAVAATMIGVTRRVANELKLGGPEESIIKAFNGLFMVLPAGEEALLAVNLRQGGNLGMVRLEARDAAAAISQVI